MYDDKYFFIPNSLNRYTLSSRNKFLNITCWLASAGLRRLIRTGPWSVTTTLPKEMETLTKDSHFEGLDKAIPPPSQPSGAVPKIFYSTLPSEVILFDGKPQWANIPQTQLLYATNTDSPIFLHSATNEYYYLAAGRWFRSTNLEATWSFASLDLPADFANIPVSSPAIRSVPPGMSTENLNSEMQNRQRGAAQSENWQRGGGSGG